MRGLSTSDGSPSDLWTRLGCVKKVARRNPLAWDGVMDTVLAVVAVVVGVLSLVYIAWTLIQPWRF